MSRAKGQTTLGPETVHASLLMPRDLHRRLGDRLFRERKSLSQWARDQAEAYLAGVKVKR